MKFMFINVIVLGGVLNGVWLIVMDLIKDLYSDGIKMKKGDLIFGSFYKC